MPHGLQSADVRRADGPDEVGVLADGLLDAPPAQVAHHVQDGRQPLVDSDRAHVAADPVGHLGDQFRVPRRSPRQRHGVGGGAPGGEAYQALLVREGRDTEPAGPGDPALGPGQGERPEPGVDGGGAERPGELAEAAGGEVVPVDGVDHVVLVRGDPVAVGVGAHPDSVELGGLLLQGHPGDQVGHPCLRGERGVAPGTVGGRGRLGAAGVRDSGDCHGGRGSSHECGGAGRRGCVTCRPPPSVR